MANKSYTLNQNMLAPEDSGVPDTKDFASGGTVLNPLGTGSGSAPFHELFPPREARVPNRHRM